MTYSKSCMSSIFFAFRNGYGHHLDRLLPSDHGFMLRGDQTIITGDQEADTEHSDANYKCTVRLNKQERSQHLENCDTCSKARLEHSRWLCAHFINSYCTADCRNRLGKYLKNLLSIIL